MFSSGENIRKCVGPPVPRFKLSHPIPKHHKHVAAASTEATKVGKNIVKLVTYPKYQSQAVFRTASVPQVILLHCKLCQRNVDWKHADMCKDCLRSKAHVTKQGKQHAAHTFRWQNYSKR